MKVLAGVDGGATKTVAVIGTLDGTLLALARGPPSNYHNTSIESAAESIRATVHLACKRARTSPKRLENVVVCLAAMDSPTDYVAGRKIADLTRVGKRRIVHHDSLAALYAATLGRPGIVVNAGTGSFAIGINGKGKIVRVGGRGSIIDDEGSAFDTARLGIRAALRAKEGSARRTIIADLLIHRFHLTDLEDIIYKIYQKPMTVEEIASISTLITDAANRGDQVAREIFLHESQALAALILAVAKRLHMASSKPAIHLTGGLFKAGPTILTPLKQELRKSIPRFTIHYPRFEPVVGGLILSLKEHKIDLDEGIVQNLQRSYDLHVTASAGRSPHN